MYYYAASVSFFSLQLLQAHEPDFNKRVLIDNILIKIIDGTPRMNFIKMLKLENAIKSLREGDRSGHGSIDCTGEKVTLKQLVEIEKSGNASPKLLSNALADATNQFEAASKDYLKEARGFKDLMLSIIQQWASLRGREDSQLCQWGKQPAGEEFSFLKRSVVTAEALDRFLVELSCFMKDLRHSCPRSTELFQKALADIRAGKKSEL